MTDSVKTLIATLNQKLNTSTNASQKNNCDYNIFNVLKVATKEVIICRFLGDLLSPDGSHGLGAEPLKLFFKTVLLHDISHNQAANATVILEEEIVNARRVDIVIKTDNTLYPIEAKIRSGDQDAQLSDYYNYYKEQKTHNISHIYYLTPNGKEPSRKSQKNLTTGKEIKCISFQKDIRNWLIGVAEIAKDNFTVNNTINQFIEVINNMCELDLLKEALGLNDKLNLAPDYDLRTAITLLSNADDLIKEIRYRYLLQHIKESEKYTLKPCEDDDLKIDPHALLRVCDQKTGLVAAWICVETNLYMGAKRVKNTDLWDARSTTDYYWQYIKPAGFSKNVFALKKPSDLLAVTDNDEINIDKLFDDIVIE